MTYGEWIALFVAGVSLVLAFLFLVGYFPRVNDIRPLVKIRVRADDRYPRRSPSGDEQETVAFPGLILGLILILLAITMVYSVLNQS